MGSLNRVTLVGRLKNEPELKSTKNGNKYLTALVTTWERLQNDSNGKPAYDNQLHLVKFWNGTAENCFRYARKEMMVIVEGKINHTSWNTPDGQKRYKTEIVGTRFQVMDYVLKKDPAEISEETKEQLNQFNSLKKDD